MSARTQTTHVPIDEVFQIQAVGLWHTGDDALKPTPALQHAWRMIQKWDHAEAAVFRWRDWKPNRFNPSSCIAPWKLEA